MGRTLALMAAVKGDRLAVRLTAAQKLVIERAAQVSGRSVTDFSVQVLTERAEEVLADRPVFELDEANWNAFVRRLDEPARPVEALVALLRRESVFEG